MRDIPATPSARLNPLLPTLIVAAVLAAYANSFGGPFVFDDKTAILENPTIRSLEQAFSPPRTGGSTVSGRPLVNASLAFNYALGGTRVSGYHAFNLGVHLASALLLFGLIRRTLLGEAGNGTRERFEPRSGTASRSVLRSGTASRSVGAEAAPLPTSESRAPFVPHRGTREHFGRRPAPPELVAAGAALLWALHPLHTAAVTYIIQRAEALVGLFMLLALYGFQRGAASARVGWQVVGVAASAGAMATKETAVVLPLLVLLYDRAFLAGSWRQVWRSRGGVHAAMIATWGVLLVLVWQSGGRDRSAGFDSGVIPFHYALTQADAIVRYLRLTVWPHPLVFDYGRGLVTQVNEVAFELVLLGGLAAATLWALRRRPAIGFLGAWFFLTLAPSSSVVPIATQTVAEHRLYLPLVALAGLATLGLRRLPKAPLAWTIAGVAIALGATTFARNRVYASEIGLWADTVRKRPENSRAQLNLGVALAEAGRNDQALAPLQQAVRLAPDDADAHNNLANVLQALGRTADALPHYAQAARGRPGDPRVRQNYGRTLGAVGRHREALEQFEAAARLEPKQASAWTDLAHALMTQRRTGEAEAAFRRALQVAPADTEIRFALGNLYVEVGRPAEAAEQFHEVLRIDPQHVRALNNLGNLHLLGRRPADAAGYYQRALAIQPNAVQTLANLGTALVLLGEIETGEQHLQRALELDPTYAPARTTLERVRQTKREQP